MATRNEDRRRWRLRLDDTTALEVAAPPGATEKQVRRRRRASLLLGALAAALTFAVVASADNVQNDVVASGTPAQKIVTVTTGDATGATVGYNVAETAGDSTDTSPPNPQRCNAADGTGATVTPSGMPSGATAVPASVTFTDCTSSQGITFTASAATTPGDYEVGVSVTDAGAASGDYNTNPAKFTLRVVASTDTTAPTIECDVPDDSIWYADNVTVSCTASDTGSGLADPADAAFSLSTDVEAGQESDSASTGSREVCDDEGNCATAGPYTFMVDRKAPVITCDSPAPTFLLGQSPALVTGVATDGGSGPASQNVSASADTSSVLGNPKSVDLTAQDDVGNGSTQACAYSVIYAYSGFFRPIDNLPAYNVVKAGQAVPVKFSLGGNQGLGILADGYPKWKLVDCDPTVPQDGVEETITAGQSSLSYDAVADEYVYVWKTDKAWAGKCMSLEVKLVDGTSHYANFKFSK